MNSRALAIGWRAVSVFIAGLAAAGLFSGCGQSSSLEKPAQEVRGAPIRSLAEKPAPAGAAPSQSAAAGNPAATTPAPSPGSVPSAPSTEVRASTKEASTTGPAAPASAPSAGTVSAPVAADGSTVALSFEQLAGYTFEVSDELLGPVTNDVASAAEKTNAQIPATVKSYDRKKVALRGFMLPLKVEGGLVTEMLIMKDQSMCCYGTTPRINDWVSVKMKSKGVRPMMDLPVTLSGTMRVGEMRENGYLVGIYSMDGETMDAPEP